MFVYQCICMFFAPSCFVSRIRTQEILDGHSLDLSPGSHLFFVSRLLCRVIRISVYADPFAVRISHIRPSEQSCERCALVLCSFPSFFPALFSSS